MLMFGVEYNAHETLKVLLREEALEYNSKDHYGYSVLDLVAFFGDPETLHSLQSSPRIKTVNINDSSALDRARWRRDDNESWSLWTFIPPDKDPLLQYSAFEALWNSLAMAQQRDFEVGSEKWEGSVEEELTDDDENSELGDDDEES